MPSVQQERIEQGKFMSTALKKSTDRFALLLVLLLAACSQAPPVSSGPGGESLLELLGRNAKIANPAKALQPYREGAHTTRFIVRLREPQQSAAASKTTGGYSLRTEQEKKRRRELVQKHVSKVISELNLPERAITGHFQYMFAFSADVTPEQLLFIVEHPEVEAIERDAVMQPHSQGAAVPESRQTPSN